MTFTEKARGDGRVGVGMKSVTMSDAVRNLQSRSTLDAMGFIPPPDKPVKPPVKAANKMSKTEMRYLSEILQPQVNHGMIPSVAVKWMGE